jgi:hypothetical protein
LDDDVVLIPFMVISPGTVTMQTTSFASGLVGFQPVLTLFDGGGNLLFQDATGGTAPGSCGARSIDAVSGACGDAYIQATLGPDSYTLALTQWDNIPNGPTLADGFPRVGEGNFTGPSFLGSAGSFILSDGSQRNSAYALSIDGDGVQSAPSGVPEPATFGVLAFGLLGIAAAGARRRLVARLNRITATSH